MNSRWEYFRIICFFLILDTTASSDMFNEKGKVSIIYDVQNKGISEVPEPCAINKLLYDADKPYEYKYYIGKKEEGIPKNYNICLHVTCIFSLIGDILVAETYDVVQYASYHDLKVGMSYCDKMEPCSTIVNFVEIIVRQSSEEGSANLGRDSKLREGFLYTELLCVKITYVMFYASFYGNKTCDKC